MKRRWLLWLLAIAFVWLVVSRFAEIKTLLATLSQGQWQWVLAAAVLQLAYYAVYAGLYRSSFDAVGVEGRVRELLPVLLGSIFVNVAAPAGGLSGTALFVDDAARRGQSPARAAAGTLLVLAADFGAFVAVLAAGLAYLFRYHDLKVYEIVGAIILLAITGGLASVLLLGLWQPGKLRALLSWVEGLANRLAVLIRRPPLLPGDWAERNAAEFSEAAVAIAAQPRKLGRTLAVALAAHLVDLASLYAVCLAFRQPVSLGMLVAGYAIGILFWIVAITPQGIGVVEGVMALVFASLGVPATTAAAISLAYRGLTFWLPLALGFFLLQRVRTFGAHERSQLRGWNVHVVALLTALMGVINVLSAVTPSVADRLVLLRRWSPLVIRRGGHLTVALAGFALLILAGNLWRRKRVAWMLTLIVLAISVVSHLVKGLDYEEALLAGALGVWLYRLRPLFHARSDPPSIRQGMRALAAALLFTMAYGVVGFYFLDRHFSVNFGLWAALEQTVVMFTAFYDPGLVPLTRFGRYFADSIYMVGVASLGYGLFMLLRPVLVRQPATPEERLRAQAIVEAHGRSSLASATLFDDKSYYFSPGGSLLAYVVRGRVALTLGDPIGPAEDAAAAIAGFREFCARNDWQPVFYQTLPGTLALYRAAGFSSLCIGHEAIVDLASFTLAGHASKSLRAAVNRLTKLGYRAELHQPPLSDILVDELRSVSDEWLSMTRTRELRFSLGWFDDEYIRRCPVMAVQAPDGAITAFANIVPEYQANEATIDLMRRRRDVESGTMDYLFVTLFEWARAQGYATFNLGLSALSGIGEHSDDPAIERALHFIYDRVGQFYNYKGLHAFKGKFHPQWSPRYLIHPGMSSLPAVSIALIGAHTGRSPA